MKKLSVLQSGNVGHAVIVKFREPLEDEWLKRLSGIDSLASHDRLTWNIATKNADLLKKQLLEMSLQHNLNIVSLQSESRNLEDIFRQLTNKE